MARTIVHAATTQRLRLTEDDLDLLAELLSADGADNSALEILHVTDLDPMPSFSFAPSRWLAEDGRVPAADTRTAYVVNACPDSACDQAVLRAAAEDPEVRAVWRAWRFCGAAAWPRPRRVYVLETEPAADLPAIETRVHVACRRAGERDPQIEVYPGPLCRGATSPDGHMTEPPSYQRLARDHGALLWARREDPGIRRLRMISAGPGQHRHGRHSDMLGGNQRQDLLRYLHHGVPVALTPALATDSYRPDHSPTVPMNYRTDGFWLWSDADSYYMEHYQSSPDPVFVADVVARRFEHPGVDGATLHRARAVLMNS